MALKSSPALAETLADLLSEMGTCFHNEEFAMTPLGEVQVLVPMNGGAWTSIMSFRLTGDGSPETPATEEKSKHGSWLTLLQMSRQSKLSKHTSRTTI